MGAGDIKGGEHESLYDAHFDIMIGQFGTIGNVFASHKARGKSFHQGFTIRDPFNLEVGGEREGEEDSGMT